MKYHLLTGGETPLALSARCGIPICMLYAANSPSSFRPGGRILVPSPRDCQNGVIGFLRRCSPRIITYRVCQGDTMFGIAAHFGTSMDLLRSFNPSVRILPGAVLLVPCPGRDFIVYSVKPTDTPASIEARFGDIGLYNADIACIYPGMQLIVPKKEQNERR